MTNRQRRMERIRVLLATRNDPYDDLLSHPVASTSSAVQGTVTAPERSTMTSRELDASIARLEADEKRRNGEWGDGHWYDRYEAVRRNHDRSGAYRPLERAIARLSEHDRRFINWVYSGLQPELDWGAKEREKRIVSDLERMMPGKSFTDIGIPDWAAEIEIDLEALDVQALTEEGVSKEEIAAQLGLSQETVRRRRARRIEPARIVQVTRRLGVYWWSRPSSGGAH